MRSSLPILALGLVAMGCSSSDPARANEPGPIELITDGLGITHVYASDDAGAFYGAGYAMARDRLFQMEIGRRQALGTLAEVLGAASVKDDTGARALNFAHWGQLDWARMQAEHPDDAPLFDAWTRGVNARLSEVRSGKAPRPYGLGPAELDFVPDDWETWHAFAIGKRLTFGLSSTLDYELLASAIYRIVPDFASRYPLLQPAFDVFGMKDGEQPPQLGTAPPPLIGPPVPLPPPPSVDVPRAWFADLFASNNWAVGPSRSASGKSWLAGDPHQTLTSPSRFWPLHMNSADAGGTLDVAGFAFVGAPTVQLGHNRKLGWTATTNYGDGMDIWDVTLSPDSSSVRLGDADRPVVARKESIRVLGPSGKVGDATTTDVTIYDVPGYGVILPDAILPLPRAFIASGNGILLGWVGFKGTPESASFLGIDRAQSVDEFERAVDLAEVGGVNYLAADADDITYHVHVQIPDRGDPSSHPMPWRMMKGDDQASLWTRGFLGADKLPSRRNPEKGYLSTANNDPWGFTADGDVENDAFYYGGFYATAFRAFRVDQALQALVAKGPVARADMEALQRDQHSVMADALLPMLADALAARTTDPALAAWATRDDLATLGGKLAAWDRDFGKDQGEPLVLLGLEWFAAKRLFEEPMTSTLFEAVGSKSPPFLIGALHNTLAGRYAAADTFLPAGGRRALLLASLDDTAAWLTTAFGGTDPAAFKLADVQAAVFSSAYGHDLALPRFPVGGHVDTVNVAEVPFFGKGAPLGHFDATQIGLYRMVVGFDAAGDAEATVDFAGGSSGDPTSPHFGDQMQTWLAAGHVPLPFHRADVEAAAESRTVLSQP